MIFYNLTHGYRSKVQPSKMFSEESEARKFDDDKALEYICKTDDVLFKNIMAGTACREWRDAMQLACAHVVAVLAEIASDEDRKAREAARAAEPEPTPPDEPEFAEVGVDPIDTRLGSP